jgi:hypothetical protein
MVSIRLCPHRHENADRACSVVPRAHLNALRDSVKGEPRGEAWLAQVGLFIIVILIHVLVVVVVITILSSELSLLSSLV